MAEICRGDLSPPRLRALCIGLKVADERVLTEAQLFHGSLHDLVPGDAHLQGSAKPCKASPRA